MATLYRGMVSSFRTPGVAVANQSQLCIFNKTGSGVLVAVHRVTFDHDRTTNSANQRFYGASRITTAPTDGTLLTPVAFDTALTHNANVEVRALGSADGTSGTFTATPGVAGWKSQGTRVPAATPPGQFYYPDNEILPNDITENDPVILAEGQGLLIVEVDAGSTSGHVLWDVAFVEYTPTSSGAASGSFGFTGTASGVTTLRWTGNGLANGTTVTAGNVNTAGNGNTASYQTAGAGGGLVITAGDGVEVYGSAADIRRIDGVLGSGANAVRSQVIYTPRQHPTTAAELIAGTQDTGSANTSSVGHGTTGDITVRNIAGAVLATLTAGWVVGDRYLVDRIAALSATPSTSNGRFVVRVTNLTDPSWNGTGVWFYDSGYTVNGGTVLLGRALFGKLSAGVIASGTPALFEHLGWGTIGRDLTDVTTEAAVSEYFMVAPDLAVTGAASASFGFTGTASGIPETFGAASATFGFTATASGVDRALGVAAAVFGFTGTAAGIDRALGAASGSFGFTATASGVSGTPPVQGAASAAFGFTATAAGVPETFGAASASFGFTGTAAGIDRALGAALASLGFTGAAAGIDRALGAALASLGFTGAASGRPRRFGVAVATFGFTGAAQGFPGSPPVTGTAVAAFGFTATATGQPRALGVAVASFGFTGAANGQRRVVGLAVTTFGFTGTTAGTRETFGVAVAVYGFAATASGNVVTSNDGKPVTHPVLIITTTQPVLIVTTVQPALDVTTPQPTLQLTEA